MSTVKCQVCSTGSAKYKCPTCQTATCCLNCSKTHQAECALKSSVNLQSQDEDTSNDASIQHSSSGSKPSIQISEIEALFEQHPSLRGQLRNVYNATQGRNKPDEVVANRSRTWSSNHNLQPEHGTRAGLQALDNALQADITHPSSMRAFLNLIDKAPT